ncbi:Dihydrofolate synthase / Folylpolyglutamate synthase [Lachnospiraceae bacterium TWA4]|nr:Dihydrofolate synthase / Folylpolyglutamate synthase [Lachnospiraceae bacterium TWA4]
MFTYEDAVSSINNIPKFLSAPSVEHTASVLEAIGRPDRGLKIIHVAGTNGKGSVCAFLTNMLMKQGYRVGTFTSPHLIKMNERIKINDEPVSDDKFLTSYLHVKECCANLGEMNYFEYLFAMGMDIFSKEHLDYVILEVGLGGRMDGTNAIEHPACSVIVSISFDHVEILGHTLKEIAYAKAGIIKEGHPVVFDASNDEVSQVILDEATKMHSQAYGVGKSYCDIVESKNGTLTFKVNEGCMAGETVTIPFIATYQAANTMIALAVMETLGHLQTDEQKKQAKEGLLVTKWPGRMQQVLDGVFMDGAHNEDGIAKFVETVNTVECKGRKLLLFSAVKEKDVDLMARHIGKEADFSKIYLTEIENDRLLQVEVLANQLKKYYNGPVEICPKTSEAFDKVLADKQPDDKVFIAGSLYLVGTIMELIQKKGE